jgi:putative flippase GtrA
VAISLEALVRPALPAALPATDCAVEIAIPVHDEEDDLALSVERLHAYLSAHFPFPFRITVADNASTDATWPIAQELAERLPHVHAIHLDQKGRGRALRAVWEASDAAVVAYMDVDLSTDLAALLPLVAPLISGHSDVAIGSRLSRSSRVVRGAKREAISRSYNVLLRTTLRARFSDAQCGFKALRADCAKGLLPLVEDGGWFFDTELLVLAERAGLRIHEVPVDWVDDPSSSVDVVATAVADLRGIARVGRALATGALPLADVRRQLGREPLASPVAGVPRTLLPQALRFGAVGVASTLAYLALYVLLRAPLGAQGANLVALLVTTVFNTAANRRLTFGLRGRGHAARSQVEGLVVLGVALALTSGALGALGLVAPHAARAVELAVLVAANAAATVARFALFRAWVFHPRRHADPMTTTTDGVKP